MGIRQKRHVSRAECRSTKIKVNPTKVHEQMGHPVVAQNHSLHHTVRVVPLGGPDDDPPVLAAGGHVGAVGGNEESRDGAGVSRDP